MVADPLAVDPDPSAWIVCVAAFVTSVVKTAVGAPDVTVTDCVVVPCCPASSVTVNTTM